MGALILSLPKDRRPSIGPWLCGGAWPAAPRPGCAGGAERRGHAARNNRSPRPGTDAGAPPRSAWAGRRAAPPGSRPSGGGHGRRRGRKACQGWRGDVRSSQSHRPPSHANRETFLGHDAENRNPGFRVMRRSNPGAYRCLRGRAACSKGRVPPVRDRIGRDAPGRRADRHSMPGPHLRRWACVTATWMSSASVPIPSFWRICEQALVTVL